MRYLIRARDLPELMRLIGRVRKIARGAALMTETRVESQVVSAVSNLLANAPLEKAMSDHLIRLGPPPFDEGDRADAAKFQATLTDEDIEASYRRSACPCSMVWRCATRSRRMDAKGTPMMGSTDVGDVSLGGADGAGRGRPMRSARRAIPGRSPRKASYRRRTKASRMWRR